MIAIFDQNSLLVGWASDDYENLFDTKIKWVGFMTASNVFRSDNLNWVGPFSGGNYYDTSGKPFAWSNSSIQSMLKPLPPLRPLKPLKPLKPLRPLNPLKPLKPLTPLGGWSRLSFKQLLS
jgi:hypothetical protein